MLCFETTFAIQHYILDYHLMDNLFEEGVKIFLSVNSLYLYSMKCKIIIIEDYLYNFFIPTDILIRLLNKHLANNMQNYHCNKT